jgi:hypothetical protein
MDEKSPVGFAEAIDINGSGFPLDAFGSERMFATASRLHANFLNHWVPVEVFAALMDTEESPTP